MTTLEEAKSKVQEIELALGQPGLTNTQADKLSRAAIAAKVEVMKIKEDENRLVARTKARIARGEQHDAECRKLLEAMTKLDNEAALLPPGSTTRNQLHSRITELRTKFDLLTNWGNPL